MERETLHEWIKTGTKDRMMSLQRNGITEKDLNRSYKEGYDSGYMYATKNILKKMFAALAQEMIDAGNSKEEVLSCVKNVDHRFSLMYDADDEIDDVFNRLGVRFIIDPKSLDRFEEV